MDSNTITALATALLVMVGIAQIGILIAQRRQSQFQLLEEYRRRWNEYRRYWGTIIFIGRDQDEYYQVIDKEEIARLSKLKESVTNSSPTIWALDSSRLVFTTLSDICLKILQNQIKVGDVYSIFGTEVLRHSKPLRVLLDSFYPNGHSRPDRAHSKVRDEVQDWLIYHDGIRRRCLILIDLLWAEAARLEDLPPSDLKSAADAKIETSSINKKRVISECIRLNGLGKAIHAYRLSYFLKNSEYKKRYFPIGIEKTRLEKLEKEWTVRLLRDYKNINLTKH
ncbi:hypothetical protein [Thiorhodococcus fuscus]|uniref:DUF4760 domain-containing protein n=1 Tax=Thiorhodococcus fuscus TaxID=527200 RepID=A0ABW4YA33_9GAMM